VGEVPADLGEVSGSAAAIFSIVASENTTPKPMASSGRLRSYTVIWCAGSAFFIKMPKNSPAGPPPMLTIFTGGPLARGASPRQPPPAPRSPSDR
jgi:hypothetical protein